jgi:hypothetical protein
MQAPQRRAFRIGARFSPPKIGIAYTNVIGRVRVIEIPMEEYTNEYRDNIWDELKAKHPVLHSIANLDAEIVQRVYDKIVDSIPAKWTPSELRSFWKGKEGLTDTDEEGDAELSTDDSPKDDEEVDGGDQLFTDEEGDGGDELFTDEEVDGGDQLFTDEEGDGGDELFTDEEGDGDDQLFTDKQGDGGDELFTDEEGDGGDELFTDEEGEGDDQLFTDKQGDGDDEEGGDELQRGFVVGAGDGCGRDGCGDDNWIKGMVLDGCVGIRESVSFSPRVQNPETSHRYCLSDSKRKRAMSRYEAAARRYQSNVDYQPNMYEDSMDETLDLTRSLVRSGPLS